MKPLNQTTAYNFPRALAEEAKKRATSLGQGAVKSVLTAGSYPLDVYSNIRGQEPMQPVNVPGIGPVKTLGRNAVDIDRAGGQTALSKAAGLTSSVGKFAGGVAEASGVYSVAKRAMTPSSEQLLERAGGWKPGMKETFDRALRKGNQQEVARLIKDVPKEYATRFAMDISRVLGTVPVYFK